MAMWNDLLLRLNLADNGTYPMPRSLPANSPDIIPYGVAPIPDSADVFRRQLRQRRREKSVRRPGNFIYARAKNLSANSATGDYYADWSPASAPMWPKQWSDNVMQTNQGANYTTFPPTPPGEIAVCGEPLKWNPRPLGPNNYYCLVGRV